MAFIPEPFVKGALFKQMSGTMCFQIQVVGKKQDTHSKALHRELKEREP